MHRLAVCFVAIAAFLDIASGLAFPIIQEKTVAPGTTIGFEYSEENLFNLLRFSGTVDCVYYSFNSTQPMNAALWFQRWEYIREYATNHTIPPIDNGLIPGSWCQDTTSCLRNYEKGNLPTIDPRRRSGFSPVPYTVVFWYGLENTVSTTVQLVVDGPCYTGEIETLTFPVPPVPSSSNKLL